MKLLVVFQPRLSIAGELTVSYSLRDVTLLDVEIKDSLNTKLKPGT